MPFFIWEVFFYIFTINPKVWLLSAKVHHNERNSNFFQYKTERIILKLHDYHEKVYLCLMKP